MGRDMSREILEHLQHASSRLGLWKLTVAENKRNRRGEKGTKSYRDSPNSHRSVIWCDLHGSWQYSNSDGGFVFLKRLRGPVADFPNQCRGHAAGALAHTGELWCLRALYELDMREVSTFSQRLPLGVQRCRAWRFCSYPAHTLFLIHNVFLS
jgi:hypothetical protein